jgi:hypothetical protein
MEAWTTDDANAYFLIYTEVQHEDGKDQEWIVAELIINDCLAGRGACPNRPPYSHEGVAEGTALVWAQHDFGQKIARAKHVRVSNRDHEGDVPADDPAGAENLPPADIDATLRRERWQLYTGG